MLLVQRIMLALCKYALELGLLWNKYWNTCLMSKAFLLLCVCSNSDKVLYGKKWIKIFTSPVLTHLKCKISAFHFETIIFAQKFIFTYQINVFKVPWIFVFEYWFMKILGKNKLYLGNYFKFLLSYMNLGQQKFWNLAIFPRLSNITYYLPDLIVKT